MLHMSSHQHVAFPVRVLGGPCPCPRLIMIYPVVSFEVSGPGVIMSGWDQDAKHEKSVYVRV